MFVVASVGDNIGANDIVGPSNALYVDVAGVDATAQRGNAAQPFLTIQAALDAQVTDFDEIFVGPGTFVPAAALTVKAGIKGCTIRGSGIQTTFITPPNNINGFNLSTAGMTQFSMTDLAVNCSGTGKSLFALGTTTGLLSTGLICDRVSLTVGAAGTLAIDFTFVGVSQFNECRIPVGSVSFVTCSSVVFRDSTISGTSFLTTWDNTNVLAPAGGQNLTQIISTSVTAAMSMTGQARLTVDAPSAVTSLTGLNMSVAAGPVSPLINFKGSVGTVDFGSVAAKILPDSALGAYTVDFSDCTITGASAEFETVTTDLTINMTGFKSTAAVFALTAGVRALIVALGASIRTTAVATMYATPDATGSITPPYLKGLVDIAAGGAVAKTWADLGYTGLVRVGTTTYNANVTSNVQVADAVVPAAGKIATGLTITSTAAAGNVAANCTVIF